MTTQNASILLERLFDDGIALKVSHRARRRLYALKDLVPLREAAAPPRRPQAEATTLAQAPAPPPVMAEPLPPLERARFAFTDLDAGLAELDRCVQRTQRRLAERRSLPAGRDGEDA